MKASSVRNKDIIQKLLEHNVNVNATDKENRSAVHFTFDRHMPFDGGYQGIANEVVQPPGTSIGLSLALFVPVYPCVTFSLKKQNS